MSFMNEVMPDTEKARLPIPVYTRRDGSKPTLSEWTVDHDRHSFLVLTNVEGGPYEGTPKTEHYALCVEGRFTTFKAMSAVTGNVPPLDVHWKVWDVSIPVELEQRSSEVLSILSAALDASGIYFQRKPVRTVSVAFERPSRGESK